MKNLELGDKLVLLYEALTVSINSCSRLLKERTSMTTSVRSESYTNHGCLYVRSSILLTRCSLIQGIFSKSFSCQSEIAAK